MQDSKDQSEKPKKQFTSEINPYSNQKKTWANIKRLCGLYAQKNTFGHTWS